MPATYQRDLAGSLESGESEEKVVEMLWKLLEKEIKCLGERHPDTANTRQVLGVMLRQEGEQVVAREMARPLREKKGESESAVAAEWDEARELRARIPAKHRTEMSAHSKDVSRLNKAIHELVPKKQRQSFVWFYERVDAKASGSR